MMCPPLRLLELLLAEQLDEHEIDRLSAHLEVCHRCRDELDRLSTPKLGQQWSLGSVIDDERAEPSTRFLRSLQEQASGKLLSQHFGDSANWRPFREPPEGYDILEPIGRGGGGLVYKARDRRLNRLVALKILHSAGDATESAVARFRKEAQAIARLRHPNIVQIFDVGEHEGRPFLVLEYVDGKNLAQILGAGPLAPGAASSIVQTIADAINYAHQRGIIHRDLKPQNILIDQSPVPGLPEDYRGSHVDATHRPTDLWKTWIPKVTDFGLAKRDDTDGLTRTGEIVGTPSYMAPEQARGEHSKLSPSVDVYGLGAILYHLVTGRPPFQGVSAVETLIQVLHGDPVAPRQLQPSLPVDLETICLKCLEKKPGRRYPSAGEVAEDLRRFRSGQPIRARRLGPFLRTWRLCQRHPLATTFVAAWVIAFAAVTWSLLEAESARKSEFRARIREQQQRELAELHLHYSRIAQADGEWHANNVGRAETLLDLCQPKDGRLDRRDWEWHYLKRLCHADGLTRRLHHWPIYGLTFSPDGRYLVSAAGHPGFQGNARTTPGEVRIWETESFQLIAELPGHAGRACSVVFSPQGGQLASVALDDRVRLWDVASWRETAAFGTTVFGDFSGVGISYSPDGKQLAVGNGHFLQIRDSATAAVQNVFGPFAQQVVNAVFSPNDNHLAIGFGTSVAVVDQRSREELFRISGSPLTAAFSPNGQILALAREHMIGLYDASTGHELLRLFGHDGLVRTLAWSSDGQFLASGSADQTVRLWDPRTGAEIRRFRGHKATVLRIAFHPQSEQLVSADMQGTLKLWNTRRDQRGDLFPVGMEVCDLAFLPNSNQVVIAHTVRGKGLIQVFDAQTGRSLREVSALWARRTEWPIKYTAFSNDGRMFAAPDLHDPKVIHVWDATSHQILNTFRGHRERVRTVAFSADNQFLASAAGIPGQQEPGELCVWPLSPPPESNTSVSVSPLRLPSSRLVNCLAFSPDNRWLATGERPPRNESAHGERQKGTVSIWNLKTGTLHQRWEAHETTVQCVIWHPSGRLVASGGRAPDQSIHIWDAETGTLQHAIQGPPVLTCLSFSPNGHRLAAVGYDGVVLLIDPFIGQEVFALRGLTPQRPAEVAADSQVIFSSDGNKIAVNVWNGSICVYDATPLNCEVSPRSPEP